MTERLNTPISRERALEDYAELRSYGVAHEDAARRLGVTVEQMDVWLQSAVDYASRQARKAARKVAA